MQPFHGNSSRLASVPFTVPEPPAHDDDTEAFNHLFLEGLGLGFLALALAGQKMATDLSVLQSGETMAIRPEAMIEPLRMFKPGA